ncbi:Aspartate-semialdehyde dehydrogenase [bacterium HR10]|nr:Aspartate-semialdehyde dehydrogenase [bacterium HR10]
MRGEKIPVGILGATGIVGQRLVALLEQHPWFEVTEVAASDRSAGLRYEEAVHWLLPSPIPERVRRLVVKECAPGLECQLVFSALPADVAAEVEPEFARAGYVVCSNASAHRLEPDVPLLIPEVNPDHLQAIAHQRRRRGWARGFIVTNPNCSTIHLTLVLKPLMDRFGLRQVMVTTLQALSGAGYPGVTSLDIVDNVIPFIKNEEEKLETETRKLLGRWEGEGFAFAPLRISAQCNRVPTLDGHMECVSLAFERRPTREEIIEALASFASVPQQLRLPTAPARPIVVREEPDRPQPRLDREVERGMASVVGRIRPCAILDYKMVILGHNTIRGAAGAALLNAELLLAQGWLP